MSGQKVTRFFQQLKTLELFCNKWSLEVNTTKTKVSVFNSTYHCECSGIFWESVDEYKYLGVWISKHRTFRKAICHLGQQEKSYFFG